jgi:hypothetical protein
MLLVTSLIRTYTSHGAYEQDAARLARMGYVMASVVEEPGQWRWAQRLPRLFGSARVRLIVTYSDYGDAPPP